MAFNWKMPDPCGPETGNVQETDFLRWATARDASYHGPLAIGTPIASTIFWFWLAFSIALLESAQFEIERSECSNHLKDHTTFVIRINLLKQ